jgi:hypothetical protein
MPVRKKNTIFSIWTLAALLLLGTIAWFAFLYRHGIELPSLERVFSEGSSEYWSADGLVAHLHEKGLQCNAVKSAKEDPTRLWTVYLFQPAVENPVEVATYFDNGAPDAELPKYLAVRVEKCLTPVAASTRASGLGQEAFAWGSYVIHGDPTLVGQIRQVLP